MPVFVDNPSFPFIWMPSLCPFLKVLKQCLPTVLKGGCCYHGFMVIRPSSYHSVHLFNQLSLWSISVLFDENFQCRCMALYCFFTRFYDGFEAKFCFSGMTFPTGNCRTVHPRKSNPVVPW